MSAGSFFIMGRRFRLGQVRKNYERKRQKKHREQKSIKIGRPNKKVRHNSKIKIIILNNSRRLGY